jgi:hypothetical protein
LVIAKSVRDVEHSSKEAVSTVDVSWRAEALSLAHNLPSSFAEVRKAKIERWEDLPFALHVEGETCQVSFPVNKPASQTGMAAAGFLLEMCERAKIEIVNCTGKDIVSPWKTCGQISDTLAGALMVCKANEIVPADNIPKNIKDGFEFALWYATSSCTRETESNAFLRIKRVTSLVATVDAWNQKSSFTELLRVTAIVRMCAQRAGHKCGAPKKFLKGEGFFLEKFVGRKPVQGLYTEEELSAVHKYWQNKVDRVKSAYANIPKTWAGIAGERRLASILETFNLKTPKDVKTIEDAKEKRVPYLLITAGRGKDKRKEIAKGGTLDEKLRTIGGGDNPRIVGKVLWSPLDGLTVNQLVDASMKCARAIFLKKDTYEKYLIGLAQVDKPHADALGIASGKIQHVSSLLVELLPDRKGESPWDTLVS